MGGSDGSSSDGEAEGIGRAERARLKARRRAAREHAHAVRRALGEDDASTARRAAAAARDSAARDVQDALASKPVPEGYVRTVRTTRGLEDGGCERERVELRLPADVDAGTFAGRARPRKRARADVSVRLARGAPEDVHTGDAVAVDASGRVVRTADGAELGRVIEGGARGSAARGAGFVRTRAREALVVRLE